MWTVEGGVNRWCTLASRKTHPRMSPWGVCSGSLEGMLPGRYCKFWSRLNDMVNCEFVNHFVHLWLLWARPCSAVRVSENAPLDSLFVRWSSWSSASSNLTRMGGSHRRERETRDDGWCD